MALLLPGANSGQQPFLYLQTIYLGQPGIVRKELKKINKKRTIVNLADWELDNIKQVTNCKQKTKNESKV
jgi:hypothetical protein